jgi:hypothetical protein
MKKAIRFLVIFLFIPVLILSQNSNSNLDSDFINSQGKELDKQILDVNKKISDIFKKYDLLNTKDIRILPYETTYKIGTDFIEIEKHSFVKDDIYRSTIVGIKKSIIKFYIVSQALSKIEIDVIHNNYNNGSSDHVKIIDPSPLVEGTDDITFTHFIRGEKIIDNRKLSDFKNSTAYPVRNDMKREFLIPHLTIVYNSILFIAEAYNKSLKDSETTISEFLKNAAMD